MGGGADQDANEKIVRPFGDTFQPTGGLKRLAGNLANAVTTVSAVKGRSITSCRKRRSRVFHDQESV